MSHMLLRPILGIVAMLGVSAGRLQGAEQGLSVDMKIRAGYALGLPEGLGRTNYGFGMNLNIPVASGQIFTEVGYHWKGGRDYREGYEAPAPGKNPVLLSQSADVRHDRLSGVAVRLGWVQGFRPNLSWQVGVMLGGTQHRNQAIGTVISYDYKNGKGTPGTNDYLDTYTVSPSKGAVVPSPFAGLQWNLGEVGALELNLLHLSYKAVHYVHIPGGNGPKPAHNDFPLDTVRTQSRSSLHLELGYAFHF